RAKNDSALVATIMQWFFADSISSQKKRFLASVPYREGKHSLKAFQTLNTFFFIEMENNLGVRVGPKAMAFSFEFDSQLSKIIDLTIISDPDRSIFVAHRL